MKHLKTEKWDKKKEGKEDVNKDVMKRIKEFMLEDDEAFFYRTIQGLSLSEVEEFLAECPEFRKYWNPEEC